MSPKRSTCVGKAVALGALIGAAAPSAHAGAQLELQLFDVQSVDFAGDPDNFVAQVDAASALGLSAGTPLTVVSVGWEMNIEAFAPSWRSDLIALFTDSTQTITDAFAVRPAAAFNSPGISDHSSGGQILLADVGLPDLNLFDGEFVVEFYEFFADALDENEGFWNGSITLGFEEDAPRDGLVQLGDVDQGEPIPLPSAAAMGISALALIAARRRRA